jgi:pimeloyl-ACP methyl ester carboxylesterase
MPRAVLSQTTFNYAKLGPWDSSALPLVLVHGLAASSAFWLRAAEHLSRTHPVLLFDLRGHGRSSVSRNGYTPMRLGEDLAELLDFFALDRVVLVGHSFGGSVALHATLLCPGRVELVVIVDTRLRSFQPKLTPAAWSQWEERAPRLREMGFTIDENEPEGGIRLLTEMARAEIHSTNSEKLPVWVQEFFGQRQSRFTAARWLELVENTSLLEDIKHEESLTVETLKKIAVPIFGMYGENSPVAASGRLLKEARPETKIQIVAGAGHFFPATRPAEFVETLLNFLPESPPIIRPMKAS